MKKLPLFLAFALVLVLAVNSFSEKGNNKVLYYADSSDIGPKRLSKFSSKDVQERSKDCYFVCKDKKLFLYKGNKVLAIYEARSSNSVIVPSSCPSPSNASQVLETCGK